MFTFSVVVVDLPTYYILSFLFAAETDVLFPAFSHSTDVVVVNFVVVLKFPVVQHATTIVRSVCLSDQLANFFVLFSFFLLPRESFGCEAAREFQNLSSPSLASHADILRGSSHVPAPRTSAELKDKFVSHCSQISAGDHMQIIGDPIGAVVACVASVSSRGSFRKLGQAQKNIFASALTFAQ